jgi:uncharacterized delta-60 repeat protein
VAGRSTAAGAVVARLRATGVLDPDFGSGGRVTLAGGGSATAVAIQPDRKIVVVGNASISAMMVVTRLLPSGAPDPTFDGDGTASIDFGSTSDIAAGSCSSRRQDRRRRLHAGRRGRAVARLNSNGSLDAGFGTGGKATVDFGVATFGLAVARAPNGRIVVAGQKTGADDFAVARLLA